MTNATPPLVSTDELARNLKSWRVFDCRHNILQHALGAKQYAEGHIENAVFAKVEEDLSGSKTGRNGRHPLPAKEAFLAWLGQQGLQPDDRVVCYDESTGGTAARMWWMLRWAGHEAVSVLDGGFGKWVKEGRPVTQAIPSFPKTNFTGGPALQATEELADLEKTFRQRLLVDARAPARFRGEQEPVDPVAGHIPGARNRFNLDNVREDGTFKSPQELRAAFEEMLAGGKPGEAIHYCGSGVSACHNLLAMEVAGLPGGKLYVGSWSEWSADARRPRAPESTIKSEEIFVTKGDVRLAVWRKRPATGTPRGVLVLVHGSSVGAHATFDLRVPGKQDYSMMNWFALRGYDVWAMDHEGYGKSTITQGNSDVQCGVDDLAALLPVITAQTGAKQVSMYGLSSGALRAAAFASAHPDKVERLALDAFVWTGQGSATLEKRKEGLPFFRANARRPIDVQTIERGITGERPDAFEPGVGLACAQAQVAAGDSVPTGTFLDMTANLPVVDPVKVTVPTLLMRGQYDTIATIDDLTGFFSRLPSPDKQFAFIPGVAHSSIMGVNRHRVWNCLHAFLNPAS